MSELGKRTAVAFVGIPTVLGLAWLGGRSIVFVCLRDRQRSVQLVRLEEVIVGTVRVP